jgi:uncharacterized protein (DUF1800 family)
MGHEAAVHSLLEAGEEEDLFPAPEITPMRVVREQIEALPNIDPKEKNQMIARRSQEQIRQIRQWWIERMATTPYPAREKCVLFWHGHWATGIQKVNDPFLFLQQNQTLRARAFGPFTPFAKEISRDPAMMAYLDLTSSRSGIRTKISPVS